MKCKDVTFYILLDMLRSYVDEHIRRYPTPPAIVYKFSLLTEQIREEGYTHWMVLEDRILLLSLLKKSNKPFTPSNVSKLMAQHRQMFHQYPFVSRYLKKEVAKVKLNESRCFKWNEIYVEVWTENPSHIHIQTNVRELLKSCWVNKRWDVHRLEQDIEMSLKKEFMGKPIESGTMDKIQQFVLTSLNDLIYRGVLSRDRKKGYVKGAKTSKKFFRLHEIELKLGVTTEAIVPLDEILDDCWLYKETSKELIKKSIYNRINSTLGNVLLGKNDFPRMQLLVCNLLNKLIEEGNLSREELEGFVPFSKQKSQPKPLFVKVDKERLPIDPDDRNQSYRIIGALALLCGLIDQRLDSDYVDTVYQVKMMPQDVPQAGIYWEKVDVPVLEDYAPFPLTELGEDEG